MSGQTPLWALAAGCVPDAAPWDIPHIADQAGFASCGMWVDPATSWDDQALGRTRDALAATGLALIDVEALWLGGGTAPTDTHHRIIEAGLTLGAANVLVVSIHDDYDASVRQFRALCEMAGTQLRINLEFAQFTQIKTLADARQFLADVDHPAAGILIDLMHLNRSGESLPSLDATEFSYVQACDFLQSSAQLTGDAYISAAVDDRCPLGEGEADADTLQQVRQSTLDVSLEIRSKALRQAFPDPYARAAQIYARCVRGP